jgi:hypothetical protein
VNKALLVGYTVSIMTLSKTVLYWLQEYFSGYHPGAGDDELSRFAEVGHNSLDRLILLWIIPNGVWIVLPGILVWQFGKEIMGKLERRPLKQS